MNVTSEGREVPRTQHRAQCPPRRVQQRGQFLMQLLDLVTGVDKSFIDKSIRFPPRQCKKDLAFLQGFTCDTLQKLKIPNPARNY